MDEYNNDELDAPSWLNQSFFEKVLRKSENNDSISITEVKITPGTVKGDHYASIMFRAAIGYDSIDSRGVFKSYIIKTMPEFDGHKKDFLGESYIFETEISMYLNTIPKFEAELRNIGDSTVLGAKCVYYSLEPRKCIIFEDIVPKGYATLRERSANMEEAKAALLKLAKWHAVSYKLAAEGDTSVTDYREGFLNIKDIESMPFMTTGMDNFISIVEKIDELKSCLPKLRSIQKDLVKRCIVSSKAYRQTAPEGIFVLCHGDFHTKNMMFKRNNNGGELEDVMLLDFQICYFGPAVMDFVYAMYMVSNENSRNNHRDELVYYYASNFIETLEKLKFEGEYPKVADFYIEMIRYRHWELLLFSSFLPLWYALTDGILDMDQMMTSVEARRNVYDNPNYIEEVKRFLPIMLHQGYLE